MPEDLEVLPSEAASSFQQHASHCDLLSTPEVELEYSSRVDAIIVPTCRHHAQMAHSIMLAGRLECTLVALCSKWSYARDVKRLAKRAGIKVVAIDIKHVPDTVLPRFRTSGLLTEKKWKVFERRTDTSSKRNIGLLLAHLAGWQRVVFLDDDIIVPKPEDLNRAVQLLDRHAGVGLKNEGFPDNSVVCHAYREAGGAQDTFIGGGALAVRSDEITSFFPNIYNEDWFFLLDDAGLQPSARIGRVVQKPYDPYANEWRARTEEFGDCLAEGIFSLLDLGRKIQDADELHWARFLKNRLALIEKILETVENVDRDPAEKRQIIAALKAARGRCKLITPELCVEYLQAWQEDRLRWQQHFRDLPGWLEALRGLPADKLASRLAQRVTLVDLREPADQPLDEDVA